MLSYRHAFHAGNHADVLKHTVLVHCLEYLKRKEAPFWVIDTHAGAGVYALESETATKLGEWHDGIERVWQANDTPAALTAYRQVVQKLNTSGALRHYPGSPWIAWAEYRDDDRLRLFERHPTDFAILSGNLGNAAAKRVSVSQNDGFAGLKGLVPPATRRALVLIDPSYETGADYQDVPKALQASLERFATGLYTVWYPRLSRREAKALPLALKRLPAKSWLNVTLDVNPAPIDGRGLYGSGMFVINPPWTLHASLREAMPWLAKTLGNDGHGRYTLDHSES